MIHLVLPAEKKEVVEAEKKLCIVLNRRLAILINHLLVNVSVFLTFYLTFIHKYIVLSRNFFIKQ